MHRSPLADAFAHHVWATMRLVDACLPLTFDQLDKVAAGTFGSIIETMRHLIGADSAYLFALTGGEVVADDADWMDLAELRSVMERNEAVWTSLAAEDLDADSIVVRYRDDGSESHAPMGIRIAQALHHGTDHRSQICTALTVLGVEPPAIDVWDFAQYHGRLKEVEPPS